MNKKLRVGILFGGKSAEHEVSLRSARNVVEALDRERFEPVLIGIEKSGRWVLGDAAVPLINSSNPKLFKLNTEGSCEVALTPEKGGTLTPLSGGSGASVDVVFPILHGPFGEDGTAQGLLKLAGVPFVGAGVLGSAVGMDKDVMKRLLRDADIPIGKFVTLRSGDKIPAFNEVTQQLGIPIFIKPANMGSSVGVNKAVDQKSFEHAIQDAFRYDSKILVEEFIKAREIECAVLGNENPQASVPGEIIPKHDFYSYDAKYIDDQGAGLEIPAKISSEMTKKIQELAVKTFRVLCCEGLGRVDFFVKDNGEILVNEINTIPGFTSISMYPKMWEASGLAYRDLITKLIELAIDRFEKERKIQTSFIA